MGSPFFCKHLSLTEQDEYLCHTELRVYAILRPIYAHETKQTTEVVVQIELIYPKQCRLFVHVGHISTLFSISAKTYGNHLKKGNAYATRRRNRPFRMNASPFSGTCVIVSDKNHVYSPTAILQHSAFFGEKNTCG